MRACGVLTQLTDETRLCTQLDVRCRCWAVVARFCDDMLISESSHLILYMSKLHDSTRGYPLPELHVQPLRKVAGSRHRPLGMHGGDAGKLPCGGACDGCGFTDIARRAHNSCSPRRAEVVLHHESPGEHPRALASHRHVTSKARATAASRTAGHICHTSGWDGWR